MTDLDRTEPEAADYAPTETHLPGLEPPGQRESRLELATRRTIAQLHADDVVDERHAMILQLMLDLAGMVSRSWAKPAAGAMAAAQLKECYVLLVDPPGGLEDGGDTDDPWDRLARELGRSAAVRDPAEPVPED